MLYRLSSISGSKQVMVFFNTPTIDFALPAALVTCLDGFKLLVMKTSQGAFPLLFPSMVLCLDGIHSLACLVYFSMVCKQFSSCLSVFQ